MTGPELERRIELLREHHPKEIGCRAGELLGILEELKGLKTQASAKAWSFISQMCKLDTEARNLSKDELAEKLRREIADHIPMDTPEFALIDEAASRLAGLTEEFYIPVERYNELLHATGFDTHGQALEFIKANREMQDFMEKPMPEETPEEEAALNLALAKAMDAKLAPEVERLRRELKSQVEYNAEWERQIQQLEADLAVMRAALKRTQEENLEALRDASIQKARYEQSEACAEQAEADAKASEMMLKQVCEERDRLRKTIKEITPPEREFQQLRVDLCAANETLQSLRQALSLWEDRFNTACDELLALKQERNALKDELEKYQERSANFSNEVDRLRKELDALKLKWESDEPGKPGRIFRGLCETIARVTNSAGSSKPPSFHIEELAQEVEKYQGRSSDFCNAFNTKADELVAARELLRDCPLLQKNVMAATPQDASWTRWIERAQEEALKL